MLKTLFLFFVSTKGQKRNRSEFVNKFVGIYSYNYFNVKISLNLLVKSLLHSFFSLITWNTKAQTKRIVERPQQIFANYVHINWRAFQLLLLFFGCFQDFLIFLAKYFWSLFNFPNLIFQPPFCKSKVNDCFLYNAERL